MEKKQAFEIILVSGVSGSGKSTALRALEDIGYFRIDNLPAPMLGNFADILLKCSSLAADTAEDSDFAPQSLEPLSPPTFSKAQRKFALQLHLKDRESFSCVRETADRLTKAGASVRLLFFECQDDVVVRRFKETRRPHPLLLDSKVEGTILEALARERKLLADFREAADRILDTTAFSPHELREMMEEYAAYEGELRVRLLSFGFKYGPPTDADLLADVRFLPNPHFVTELRESTGLDTPVAEYVFAQEDTHEFVDHYSKLLRFLVPRYRSEGKRYLTIAIGCTGGRHRSVAIVEHLSSLLTEEFLREDGYSISAKHRDIQRKTL